MLFGESNWLVLDLVDDVCWASSLSSFFIVHVMRILSYHFYDGLVPFLVQLFYPLRMVFLHELAPGSSRY